MHKTLLLTAALALFSGCNLLSSTNKTIFPKPQPTSINVDYLASISIFINGIEYKLNRPQFYNRSTDVFTDQRFPNVLRIKKTQTTWGDLFNSISLNITQDCIFKGSREELCSTGEAQLRFFINGSRTQDILTRDIANQDQLLVTYGQESGINLERLINQVPPPTLN